MFHSGPSLYQNGASTHFSVQADGNVEQNVSLLNRSWHAQEASDYYFSIFHFEPFTPQQMKASALISAQIVKFAFEKWAMTIPVIRAPGPGFSPGFKEHRDGSGAEWNGDLHYDGLNSVWNWQQYLDAVKLEMEDDDMALFENKEDFRKETLKAFVGSTPDGNPRLEPEQLVEGLLFMVGMNHRMKGGERPAKADAVQKGWDFANHAMAIDPEQLGLEFPQGRLSGTLTFG